MSSSISALFAITLLYFTLSTQASHQPSLQPRGLHHTHTLSKRANEFKGRATFYAAGLGACGKTNSDSDFIVALNQAQYTANSWCFKTITITYGGKSHDATIVDECPGCPEGGLDMSRALFDYFASEDAGVFYMTWSLGGGGDGGDSKPAPPPYVPPPTPVVTSTAAAYTPSPTPKPSSNNNNNDNSNSNNNNNNNNNSNNKDNGGSSSFSSVPVTKSTQPIANTSLTTSTSPWANLTSTIALNNLTSSPSLSTSNPTTPPSQAVIKGYLPSTYGAIEPAGAYAIGGNLDTVSQLVISFGSLTAASASYAISP